MAKRMTAKQKMSRAKRKRLMKIRTLARRATAARLRGHIQRAMQLERIVDMEIKVAKSKRYGASAERAELEGQEQSQGRMGFGSRSQLG
jgi:hypothetical protein